MAGRALCQSERFSVPRRRAAQSVFQTSARGGTRASSLDQLVSPQQKRLRDREAKGLRRLDVDHELELGRLLDGQVRRLCAPENLVNIGRRATGEVRNI